MMESSSTKTEALPLPGSMKARITKVPRNKLARLFRLPSTMLLKSSDPALLYTSTRCAVSLLVIRNRKKMPFRTRSALPSMKKDADFLAQKACSTRECLFFPSRGSRLPETSVRPKIISTTRMKKPKIRLKKPLS